MAMEHRKAIEWSIMMAEMELDEGLEAKTSEMVQIWKEQGLELNPNIDKLNKISDSTPFVNCLKEEDRGLYLEIYKYIKNYKIVKRMKENIDKK